VLVALQGIIVEKPAFCTKRRNTFDSDELLQETRVTDQLLNTSFSIVATVKKRGLCKWTTAFSFNNSNFALCSYNKLTTGSTIALLNS
jgi:hypothetical protein